MCCKKRKCTELLFMVVAYVSLITQPCCYAQTSTFVLEAEQHWETYGVGGTCISGSNNLFVGNIDSDNYIEIITGGFSYNMSLTGNRSSWVAPLRIWNWNGKNMTLKMAQSWTGNINSVFAADVDGDGKTELFTSGSMRNDTGSYVALSVWNIAGTSLRLRSVATGVSISALFASDIDNDGNQEIITVGRFNSTGQQGARLCVWRLEGDNLRLGSSAEWCVDNVTVANSVVAHDLDNDGKIEIVTGGYSHQLKNSSGQLRVWHYESGKLALKSNKEWQLVEGVYALTIAGGIQGNTVVNNVKVGDVDLDGTPEIVTGGFAYDGENTNSQLRIWSWNGNHLILEESMEWVTDYLTEIKCVSLNDVDGDSKIEIVTSGVVGAKGSFATNTSVPNMAQMRVWSWDGTTLSLEQSKDWTIGDGVCAWNVGTGDIDLDGVMEIITVGCMGESVLCDPDMRIWSISPVSSSATVYVVAVGVIALVATSGLLVFLKRRRT